MSAPITFRDIPFATTQPLDDRLTEAGAAERFARVHGDEVRFDHRRGRWLLWDRHRWLADADAGVTRLALDFAREWQRDALDIQDTERRKTAINFAIRLERRDVMNNVLALAKAMRPLAVTGDGWDADPWLLGVPNGVIDLRTGTLRSGRHADHLTMNTSVGYDPEATCPRWERFIDEIFRPHVELAGFVQRAVGYSLVGDTSEQCLFLLYGTGSNGKGTFANQLKRVLGDYAWNMPFATIEMRDRAAIPNDVAALLGRRFVIASETNDGARLNEARVKALTGCDPITARFLHSEFFTFEPVAKFWLSVNHKPIVRDDSFGFWRRIRLIPFTQTFPVNATLAEDLRAEAAGILAWAVRGCLTWQRNGLSAPAVVLDATAAYERDSDPLAEFLAEACAVDDPAASTRAGELYAGYVRWADSGQLRREDRLNKTAFGRKATERFRKGTDERGSYYSGVRLVSFAL